MRDGWVETTLGEIFSDCKNGKNYKEDDKSRGLPITRIQTISEGEINLNKVGYGDLNESNSRDFLLTDGDILFSHINSLPHVGKVAFVTSEVLPLIHGMNLLRMKFNNLCDPKFMFYTMQHEATREKVRAIAQRAVNQVSVTISNIKSIQLILPPLAEQKRIVDLISSVDSYIEALQQQVDKARKSRNAVLDELLTKGGDGWVETTLGEVAALNPEQIKDMNLKRKIRYVDLSTVNFETGIDQSIQPINFSEAPGRARRVIRENDVIISTVRPYLRGFALVDANFDGEIASTGFCVVRANPDIISPYLVWAIASSNNFVNYLIEHSTGSNYPAVRAADILEYTFLLPSKDKQKIIADLILEFDEFSKKVIDTLTKTKNLRSALLSDLLSGSHEIPTTYDKLIGAA
jgi:type I restriction enzyme S subunit